MANQIIAQGYIGSNMIITQGFSLGAPPVVIKVSLKGLLAEKAAWLGIMSERIWMDDFDPADFEEADFDMGGGGWIAFLAEKIIWIGALAEVNSWEGTLTEKDSWFGEFTEN